jgi:hypothetical protein
MRAEFRLSADFHVIVDNETPTHTVVVSMYRGVDFENPISARVPSETVPLSKAQARALASAIMGCAAEA